MDSNIPDNPISGVRRPITPEQIQKEVPSEIEKIGSIAKENINSAGNSNLNLRDLNVQKKGQAELSKIKRALSGNREVMDRIHRNMHLLKDGKLSESEMDEICRNCTIELADLLIRNSEDPQVKNFFHQCKNILRGFNIKEVNKQLKVAERLVEQFPKSDLKDGFNETVDFLFKKHDITEDTIKEEAKLFDCEPRMAKLLLLNRLFTRLKVDIKPTDSPAHTPSIAKKSKNTGYPPSLVRLIEKIFKGYVRRGSKEAEKFKIGEYTVYMNGRNITIEEKKAGEGGFKEVYYATNYFKAESEADRCSLATIKLIQLTLKGKKNASWGSFGATTEEPVFSPVEDLRVYEPVDKRKAPSESENIPSDSKEEWPESMVIDEEAGEGGQGASLDVDDQLLGIVVNPDLDSGTPQEAESLKTTGGEEYEREIKLTLELQGPGVVRAHKVIDLNSGNKVMVTEAAGLEFRPIPGIREESKSVIDLSDIIALYKKGKLSDQEILLFYQMIDDALAAVERLSQEGYIHRDLKGQNFLITSEGHCVVSDFGMTVKEGDPYKGAGGTLGYMAPEIIIYNNPEEWNRVTTQSDIWSCGMILREIFLEGGWRAHPVYKGMGISEVIIGSLKQFRDPKNIAQYEREYPEPENRNTIEHLVWSATRIDPDQRPSISKLRERFNQIYRS